MECGIDLAGFKDIRVGDVIESFTTEKLADELGQNSIAARKAEKAAKEAAAAARKPRLRRKLRLRRRANA